MTIKAISRIGVIAATVGVVGLPLTISAPANAINKPEPGGSAAFTEADPLPADGERPLDLTQLGAGTLGGIAITVAGYTAARRRYRPFTNPTSVRTPNAY
ncbi:hypothetical protein [Kribbella sp. NPDC051718]|uniref:hypothetical protein n=1 Tax=Kribbella sp. NPDC051718 TaxID=3155168 RepID=UPI003434DB23